LDKSILIKVETRVELLSSTSAHSNVATAAQNAIAARFAGSDSTPAKVTIIPAKPTVLICGHVIEGSENSVIERLFIQLIPPD
jgi:hypothetical protein